MLLNADGTPIDKYGQTLKHELHSLAEGDNQPSDMALAKFVMEELEKSYPHHPWWVTAEAATGVVVVRLNYLNRFGRKSTHGFVVHIDRLKSHDGFKEVMRAGGELLERHGLARGPATPNSRWYVKENDVDMTVT